MKNNLLNQENSEARFTMTFEPEEVRSMRNRVYRDYQKHISFSGFRKGRVPFQIAEKMLGKGFLDEDLIETLIDDNLKETIETLGLKEMSQPRLEKFEFGSDGSLELTILQAIEPNFDSNEITTIIKNIDNKEIPELEGEALEAAVNKKKDQLSLDFAEKTISEEPAQNGDYLKISFNGTTKNSMLPRDYYFELGSENNVLPLDIQEKFVGMKKGVPFEIELNGENIETTIDEIYKLSKPEINDAFIEENFFMDTPENFYERLENMVSSEFTRTKRFEIGKEILDKILEEYPIEFSSLYVEDIENGLNPKLVEVIETLDPEFAQSEDKVQAFLNFQKRFMLINYLAELLGSTQQGSPFYTDFYLHDHTTRNLEEFEGEDYNNLRTYVSQFDTLYNFVLPDLAILKDYLITNEEA